MSEALLQRVKSRLPELQDLYDTVTGHWAEEDHVYRYYHHSFKVYWIQSLTQQMVKVLTEIGSDENLQLNPRFRRIISAGTGIQFSLDHNSNWDEHTLPQLEAFWHAKYMLQQMVKYGQELEHEPQMCPSGWLAVLYLYCIR